MHAKPDLRVFFEVEIAGSGPVIVDVIQTNFHAAVPIQHQDDLSTRCLGQRSLLLARYCDPCTRCGTCRN